MTIGALFWGVLGLVFLWLVADLIVVMHELSLEEKRLDATPYRVACPRCGATPWVPCRGMRYEVHAARDRELYEERLRELEYK